MANSVAIVTDTTACIPAELVRKYQIEVIPIQIVIGGKAYPDAELDLSQFYRILKESPLTLKTVGSLPGPYIEAFTRLAAKTDQILCITEPVRFSGMFNAAQLAAMQVLEKYSNLRIKVIPCETAAAGLGLVVLEAARQAEAGKSLDNLVGIVSTLMQRVYLYAALDTFDYLIRGGRIPKIAALADALLQIKPVFTLRNGDAQTVALPRTAEKALQNMLDLMMGHVKGKGKLKVAVMHADALEWAHRLEQNIKEKFPEAEILIMEFTPVMGVHTGPGVVGVAFYET
ncbi:fatty acid-binding protein DegV [Dehalococcoides mccartyi]|uniref:DegV family protein n=1 Tax=Dehalococcoides mccartyi TaxID=61435 RepID=UPI00099D7050|nr:DegV family protein [Dehalococcoides mccartyi]AQX74753.1 fatty acid-binding protein DegV [Dehalococcoides mccartyi]AQY73330.1 fatty acid-binding protein DegV [Dehalococcoides mccartyi]